MAAMPRDEAKQVESFYTPQRIESLLRQLPYLLDRQSYEEHKTPSAKPTSANSWAESRMSERADVEWALQRLPAFQYRVVYLTTIGDKSLRDVASIVGKSHVTVRQNRIDGINMMAWLLGWRNVEAGWG